MENPHLTVSSCPAPRRASADELISPTELAICQCPNPEPVLPLRANHETFRIGDAYFEESFSLRVPDVGSSLPLDPPSLSEGSDTTPSSTSEGSELHGTYNSIASANPQDSEVQSEGTVQDQGSVHDEDQGGQYGAWTSTIGQMHEPSDQPPSGRRNALADPASLWPFQCTAVFNNHVDIATAERGTNHDGKCQGCDLPIHRRSDTGPVRAKADKKAVAERLQLLSS